MGARWVLLGLWYGCVLCDGCTRAVAYGCAMGILGLWYRCTMELVRDERMCVPGLKYGCAMGLLGLSYGCVMGVPGL
eukprot:1876264-Pyramimonas_sp.AAC.1